VTLPGTTPAPERTSPSDIVAERHVLCVDDDPEFLKSLEFFLPDRVNRCASPGFWYRFLFFTRPQEALEMLSELSREGETVAMLISDQKMPNMKGTELLSEARSVSSRCVRVLLTGYAGIESAILAINERLLDKYLTKPIDDPEGFAVSIQHLLEQFEMRQRMEQQSQIIAELYQFSNDLNARDELVPTLERIVEFASQALASEQAFVLARDGQGQLRSARVGFAGGVESWLSLPLISTPMEQGTHTTIRTARTPADLVGEIWNVEEAIRQAPQFPMLTATLAAEGEILAMIGLLGRPARQPFDEEAHRTLSYVASTASITLRKLRSRERLQEAYRMIQTDARRLAEANQRLRILDQARADFLAFISHELAIPVTLMSGVQLLGDATSPNGPSPILEGLREGYQQLKEFIERGRNCFAWMSRPPSVSTDLTDLTTLVSEVIGAASLSCRDRIAFERRDAPRRARIPEDTARSILNILLDNAVKFSGETPEIAVTVETEGDQVWVGVSDRGRGFPPGWGPELTRPFAIPDSLHHHRGSGLNVATAAAMAAAYGGSLEASSGGWDKGATFTLRLPGENAPTTEPAALQSSA
jgi:signal transduction histidine kinase/FixJ family two-component response regulator